MDLISQIIPICFRTPPEKSAPAYHNNPLDTMFLSLQFRFEEKKKIHISVLRFLHLPFHLHTDQKELFVQNINKI